MSAVSTTNEERDLRRLIPLNTLSESRLEQVCSEIKIEEAPKGTILFYVGDQTHDFVYLLSGTISLQAGGVEMDSVSGGSDVARFALAHQNPRKVSAVAKTQIRYVRVNPELINQREEPPPQSAGFMVSDTPEDKANDWMSALLRSPIFQRLPPANLQGLLRIVQEIRVKAGDVICRQDAEGDYFYIIKNGQCSLTRKPTPTAREIKLTTLKTCDTFGEDALISEKPRTVTVTMDTDGQLLRLDKANFLKLVRDPVINRLSADEATAMVAAGGIWLDVRLPDQYQQGHPAGPCINAPFFSLRMILPTLDRKRNFVVVCEDGKLSEAAAYLLLRYRFNAYVLKDGIGSLPAPALTTEPSPVYEAEMAEAEPAASEARRNTDGQNRQIAKPESTTPADAGQPMEPAAESQDGTGHNRGPSRRGEHDLRDLEARLARMISEKETSDTELHQARHTVHKLETALQTLQREHERLSSGRSEDSGLEEESGSTAGEDLMQELEELKARYAEVLFEKESAEQEIQGLEAQVGDLKAMVEEFLEHGDFASTEDSEALRTELDMVREQAGAELLTFQSMLNDAEAENVRLRSEVQSLQTQLSVRDVAVSVHAAEKAAAKRSLLARSGWALAAGLLLTALALGGLFGLEPGREIARSWLVEAAPVAPVEAPN